MQKEKDDLEDIEKESSFHDPVEVEISNFSAKIGSETNNKYFVYLYRCLKDEDGRKNRPFLKRFEGVEPDPQDIANNFRGGKYLITFVWKQKGTGQKSKSFVLDVDPDAYPPAGKEQPISSQLVSLAGNSGLSDSMKFQLAMLQTIGEVMKSAYSNGGSGGPGNGNIIDPMEQFSGVLQAMENNYASLMNVQSKMFERVISKNMEIQYGLSPESPAVSGESDESGIMGKYGPLIKELIGGLKIVLDTFGNRIPKEVVKRVQGDDRFKELRQNPKALVAVGQTLRREFGNDRAAAIMRDFGVRVEYVSPQQQIKTPDIPLPAAAKIEQGKGGGKGKVSAGMVKKGVPVVAGKDLGEDLINKNGR